MRREWLRSTQPHPPARALSARNGIFGCGDRAPEIAERDNELPQRLKRRRTDSAQAAYLSPTGKYPVRQDWVVGTTGEPRQNEIKYLQKIAVKMCSLNRNGYF